MPRRTVARSIRVPVGRHDPRDHALRRGEDEGVGHHARVVRAGSAHLTTYLPTHVPTYLPTLPTYLPTYPTLPTHV